MIDSVAVIRAHRAGGLAAATATVAVVLAISAAGATASTPPSSTVPLSPGGVMAGPDGGFEVQFSAAPIVITDPAGTSTSYLARVDEDTETVSVVPPAAFGAASEASATDRVALFLDASGDGIDVLANTPTRLGPLPAAYFISRITLADGNRAVLYGAVVVRPGDVNYVVYTDIGGDDADRARHFVESYTAVIAPPPTTAPPTTSVSATTSTPTTAPSSTTTTTTSAATATTSTAPSTTSAPTTAPAPTTTVPAGATVSFDEDWWIEFPDDAAVTLRASSADGFAYAEYAAVVGDDVLSVRVTELPAAFRWDQASAAEAEADRTGSTVVSSEVLTVNGSPSVRFTLDNADGESTTILYVRTGDQLYRVAYADGGAPSDRAATAFVDSFHLR